MLRITKIFRFEMAHALHGYPGSCRYIHGHSYELHVTVSAPEPETGLIPAPGILIDFKQLKSVVETHVIKKWDHHLLLSQNHIADDGEPANPENLVVTEAEPSAENMLLMIREVLIPELPADITLQALRLYETRDSFAEWIKD